MPPRSATKAPTPTESTTADKAAKAQEILVDSGAGKRKAKDDLSNPAPAKAGKGPDTSTASASATATPAVTRPNPADGLSWAAVDVEKIYLKDKTNSTRQQAGYEVCYREDPDMDDEDVPELVIKGVPAVVTNSNLHALGMGPFRDEDKRNPVKVYGERDLQVRCYFGVVPDKCAKALPKLAGAHVEFVRKMHAINEKIKELLLAGKKARKGLYDKTYREEMARLTEIAGGYEEGSDAKARAEKSAHESARKMFFSGFLEPEYTVTEESEDPAQEKGEMEITFKTRAAFSNAKKLKLETWEHAQRASQLPLPADPDHLTAQEIDMATNKERGLFSPRYVNYYDPSNTINLGQKALSKNRAAKILNEGDVANFKFKMRAYNAHKGFPSGDPLGMMGIKYEIDTYRISIHARGPQVGELVTNSKQAGAALSGANVADDYGFGSAFVPVEAPAAPEVPALMPTSSGAVPALMPASAADEDDGFGDFT